MAIYQSMYKGAQMDAADTLSLNPDATPTENSTNLVTSGGVFSAIGSAQNASAPAILNTASGAVCSFADGSASPMTSVIAEIVASQAGSGTPYPAGGGKNKLPNIVYQNNASEVFLGVSADGWLALKAGTYTISYGNSVLGRIFYKEQGGSNIALSSTASGTFTLAADANVRIWLYNSSGVTASDVAWAQLELGSTATDYAPYSNIRPISGYTGANVTRAGRNIFNIGSAVSDYSPFTGNPLTAVDATAGTLTLTALGAGQTVVFRKIDYDAGVYTVNFTPSLYSPRVVLRCYDADNNIVTGLSISGFTWNASYQGYYNTGGTVPVSFTIPPTVDHFRLGIGVASDTAGNTVVISQIQLVLGSVAHDYEAYNGEVFSVSWQDAAGTVYGGTVDLVSGVLTVETAMFTLNGSETWGSGGAGRRVQCTSFKTQIKGNTANNATVAGDISDMFPQKTPDQTYAGTLGFSIGLDGTIHVADGSGSMDVDAWKLWLGSNNLHLALILATPQTYTLTGQEIASLLGQNNVWNDVGGDTSAEYRADTKLYIQNLLGA